MRIIGFGWFFGQFLAQTKTEILGRGNRTIFFISDRAKNGYFLAGMQDALSISINIHPYPSISLDLSQYLTVNISG